MSSSPSCLASTCHFLKYFRIEFFWFAMVFAAGVEEVTLSLLAQDKLCIQHFHKRAFCSNLSIVNSSWENSDVLLYLKDRTLAEVTTFNLYQTIIYTLPVVLFSFFFGAWADRHSSSAKVLICLTSLMASLESAIVLTNSIFFNLDVNYMLFAFIFYALVGGSQTLSMAGMSYMISTVSIDNRVFRFTILEIIQIIASPIGIFVGGAIIRSPSLSAFARSNGALHNYHQVFAISSLSKFLAFSYALLMPFEKRGKLSEELPLVIGFEPDGIPGTKTIRIKRKPARMAKFIANLGDVFVMRNVYDLFEVCFKRRSYKSRTFIWLLLIVMSLVTLVSKGTHTLMFQFVQKIYSWDAGEYSTYNSILYLATHVIGLLIATPFMTQVLKMSDNTLLMAGLISMMMQNFIRGTLFTELAFCMSYLFGSFTGLISVAVKSKLSKLCPFSELNRIFCVLTTLETISPLIGIAMYTTIFNASISSYPGLVYQLSAFLLLIPLVLSTYVAVQAHIQEDCKLSTLTFVEKNGEPNLIVERLSAEIEETSDYASGVDSASVRRDANNNII